MKITELKNWKPTKIRFSYFNGPGLSLLQISLMLGLVPLEVDDDSRFLGSVDG